MATSNNNWFGSDSSEKMRLLLTRHGETQWNTDHRIQGHTDVELGESGLRQAEILAVRLRGLGASAVYSSDLSRALETAKIIKTRLNGASLRVTPLLRERNWGVFEGKKWEEIEAQLPEEIRRLRAHPIEYTPDGGESRVQVLERINKFLDAVTSEHKGETIVAVTHGGVSSLMVKDMLGMDLSNITPFRIENCSISVADYDYKRKVWFVQCLNDMAHLDDLKII